jgi:hypothetical protein
MFLLHIIMPGWRLPLLQTGVGVPIRGFWLWVFRLCFGRLPLLRRRRRNLWGRRFFHRIRLGFVGKCRRIGGLPTWAVVLVSIVR